MWAASSAAVTSCSSPHPTSNNDIQSRMEKYLLDDGHPHGAAAHAHAPGSDDELDDRRCHGDRNRLNSDFSGCDLKSPSSSASSASAANNNSFLHPDVLDLHKEDRGLGGGGPGGSTGGLPPSAVASAAAAAAAAAAASLERDAAAVISRWQPLGQSPPLAHNHTGIAGPQLASLGLSSPPPLPLSRPGSVMHHQSSSDASALDRFRAGMRDRFDLVPSGGDMGMEPTSSTMPGTSQGRGNSGKGPRTIKSYHCRMCEQEFANKSDMQRHAKEAHRMEDKGHKCTQCLKSFPSSQQLAQHSLVHTNVRKYACSYCDKAFKQLSHVQQHQRIHTGERPYRCPVDSCPKAFRQLSSLQQHLKGHNVPMPKSFAITRGNMATIPPPISLNCSPLSGSPSSGNEESSSGNKLNSSLARPHDLTCQVCEKHCTDEVRFFCHIHKYHPDYWRVFSGGRPLSDFIETPAGAPVVCKPLRSPGAADRPPPTHREKRFACTICHKRYSHETGYVKHMAGHPGFAAAASQVNCGAAPASADRFNRVSLYNCSVCAKLFTKEAYLLRHMEMKLDPAHAAGLDELKKSSAMFRNSTGFLRASGGDSTVATPEDAKMMSSRPGSIDEPVDEAMSSPNGRYSDDTMSRRHNARSASCISPLSSASSSSPATPPTAQPQSFGGGGYPPPSPFMPPMPPSDYLRRSMDAYRSVASYPSAAASRSSPIDDEMQGSSPEMDEGRDIRNPNPRYSLPGSVGGGPSASATTHHRDSSSSYYSPPSPYNRFQPFPSPVTSSLSRSGMVSPGIGSGPFAYPQYPPYGGGPSHLQDSYLRRGVDFTDRETVNSFR